MLEGDLAGARLVETHISRVYLRERDVIKIKKPVSLGFLDFSTIERRKVACEAEVVLGARLAPDVYLGVVPIERSGVVVDWGVHMRRLGDDARADARLERGALDADAILAVARRLAELHARARCDEETARYGDPSVILANVEENFAQTEGALDRLMSREQIAEVERWQASFVRDNDALFRARAKGGRVRDGHGDLRLEHVYLERSGAPWRVTIIDCIEFNDRFRFGDVCADIAFLSMDLAAHGRVDLAELFLAAYARDADDFDLYALVDFYESYRAFVRAKIATMIGDEASARHHLRLALAAHRPNLLSPTLVCVGGMIASGKSTISGALHEEMSAPVIDADRTRKAMIGVPATQRLDEAAFAGAYDPKLTEEVYAEVLRRADIVLASGRPVIVDASFRSPWMRAMARELAERRAVPFRFVECRASEEVCRARVSSRARGVSDGRIEIFDAFRARYEPVTELPEGALLALDTARPLEASLATLRASLATWPRGLVG